MGEIVLKKANVVKRVDSEEKAQDLEAKGFTRADGKSVKRTTGDARRGELEKELSDTKERLEAADKKIEALSQELDGTKEQLEAAIKKNKAADKK